MVVGHMQFVYSYLMSIIDIHNSDNNVTKYRKITSIIFICFKSCSQIFFLIQIKIAIGEPFFNDSVVSKLPVIKKFLSFSLVVLNLQRFVF